MSSSRSDLGWGFLAGLVGISCCVYPVVLFLLGAATASAAISLGNNLFYNWGWAFRAAGLVFLVTAVAIQRSRNKRCELEKRQSTRRIVLLMGSVSVATYAGFYFLTTWLSTLG